MHGDVPRLRFACFEVLPRFGVEIRKKWRCRYPCVLWCDGCEAGSIWPARREVRAGRAARVVVWLPVVPVASGGGGDRRTDSRNRTAEDIGTLARRETRRQQTVVDFARHREAVELRGWNEQSRVRLAAVGGAFEIGFDEREDAIGVAVHTRHFRRVGVEQALAQILDARLEGAQAHIDVQQDFIAQAARYEAQ